MAALPSSLSPSLASAYAPDSAWLTNDTTNPTGKAPVTTGPAEAIGNPVDGTAAVDLNTSPVDWQEPELYEAPPDYFAESAFPHAGPWPALPLEHDGKEPFGTLPPDGSVTPGEYKVPPKIEGLNQRRDLLPGHDRHSQDVDSAGWEQYTPSGRTAVRQNWVQNYPGVDNFWPVTQPTRARVRIASGANQEVGGTVATYGDIQNSGGSTAYEPPQPPAVTQAPATGSTGTGTIPTWGF